MLTYLRESFIKVCKGVMNHWLISSANFLAFVLLGIIAWKAWFWGLNYFLASVSVGIASIAVLNSAIVSVIASNTLASTRQSLSLTIKSLELTIATTRPFLTFSEVKFITVSTALHKGPAVELVLCNTGGLPAKEVSAALELFLLEKEGADERPVFYGYNEREVIFHHKLNLSTYFPREESHVSFFLKPEVWNKIVSSGKTLMEIKIEYQSEQKEYKLIRTLFLRTFEKGGRPTIAPEFVPGSDLSD